MSIQRQLSIEKCATDCFIDRVVTADVFADNERFAGSRENASGVNPPGAGEIGLLVTQL